jgi:hypothetical protein
MNGSGRRLQSSSTLDRRWRKTGGSSTACNGAGGGGRLLLGEESVLRQSRRACCDWPLALFPKGEPGPPLPNEMNPEPNQAVPHDVNARCSLVLATDSTLRL